MAGIYLHIPFCKQACHYCNFHFSTSLKYKEEMVAAMLREIELRRDYLSGAVLSSIYFGGGTPSLLTNRELNQFFEKIYSLFQVQSDAEITLEANPDDLTKEKLQALNQTPTNRLSIGIQSFAEEDLRFMNRAHNVTEARACIENALNTGFENLSVDLIYGAPTTSDTQWKLNIQTVVDYNISHISCYALTVEPKTALGHFVAKGKVSDVNEEQAARQFEMLVQMLRANGYEHYEISNFARPGWYARHNSSYWSGEPYLGVGPSAHSFDGKNVRQWNVANNAKYLNLMGIENLPGLMEREILTTAQRYDEYVMTALRTMWGAQIEQIRAFGEEFAIFFLEKIQAFIRQQLVEAKGTAYVLTDKGKLLADFIASELFWDEP